MAGTEIIEAEIVPAWRADLRQLAQKLAGSMSSDAVFGEPVHHGDITLVPIAKAAWGLGGGGHADRGGGGGGMAIKPIGFIVIDAAGARYEPLEQARLPGLLLLGGVVAGAVLAAIGLNSRLRTRH